MCWCVVLEDGAWVVRHHFDRAKMVWFGWTAHGAELAGGYECPVCARRGEEDIGRVMADSIEACDDAWLAKGRPDAEVLDMIGAAGAWARSAQPPSGAGTAHAGRMLAAGGHVAADLKTVAIRQPRHADGLAEAWAEVQVAWDGVVADAAPFDIEVTPCPLDELRAFARDRKRVLVLAHFPTYEPGGEPAPASPLASRCRTMVELRRWLGMVLGLSDALIAVLDLFPHVLPPSDGGPTKDGRLNRGATLDTYARALATAVVATAAAVHADVLTLGKHPREYAQKAVRRASATPPVAPVWRRFWVWRPVREFGLAEQPAVDNLHNVYAILHPHAILAHAYSYPVGPMRVGVTATAAALACMRAQVHRGASSATCFDDLTRVVLSTSSRYFVRSKRGLVGEAEEWRGAEQDEDPREEAEAAAACAELLMMGGGGDDDVAEALAWLLQGGGEEDDDDELGGGEELGEELGMEELGMEEELGMDAMDAGGDEDPDPAADDEDPDPAAVEAAELLEALQVDDDDEELGAGDEAGGGVRGEGEGGGFLSALVRDLKAVVAAKAALKARGVQGGGAQGGGVQGGDADVQGGGGVQGGDAGGGAERGRAGRSGAESPAGAEASGSCRGSSKKYLSFDEAHALALEQGFKNKQAYYDWRERPKEMPKWADQAYKGKGWVSWDHFLKDLHLYEDEADAAGAKFRGIYASHGIYASQTQQRWDARVGFRSAGERIQTFLGTFAEAAHAAEAYDVVIKHSKPGRITNFPANRYRDVLPLLELVTRDELVAAVHRSGESNLRGRSSRYRGVSNTSATTWRFNHAHPGTRQVEVGAFRTALEAARAYDRHVVALYGMLAVTNFLLVDYVDELAAAAPSGTSGGAAGAAAGPPPSPPSAKAAAPRTSGGGGGGAASAAAAAPRTSGGAAGAAAGPPPSPPSEKAAAPRTSGGGGGAASAAAVAPRTSGGGVRKTPAARTTRTSGRTARVLKSSKALAVAKALEDLRKPLMQRDEMQDLE